MSLQELYLCQVLKQFSLIGGQRQVDFIYSSLYLTLIFKTCLNFHVCIETLLIVSYPVNWFLSGRKQPQIQHLNSMQFKIW